MPNCRILKECDRGNKLSVIGYQSLVMIIFKLQEMRKKSGLTQKELSEKSGISISYIRDLEQKGAKRISTEIFDKLCKTLSCNVSDLLEFIDDS